MTPRTLNLFRIGAAALVLCGTAQGAAAQRLNENCTVSVLNRNVRVNADGSWVLPNVPANFGLVRARVTCIVNGQTVSGESDPFLVPPNGAVNVPPLRFGSSTPIPTLVTVNAASRVITSLGATLQLSVSATYANSTTKDVTSAASGTQYTISNPAIATITGNGLIQAVKTGTVLVQATQEGTSGIISIQVSPAGADTDGDGIPDDAETALGLNPLNPVDALEDYDRDGLTNLQEYRLGTNLRVADTDGDGLKDGDEVARGTNPLLRDTDGDGISDGLEVQTGSNPLNASSYNLAAALNNVIVTPNQFVLTFNTISGDVTRQLRVTGNLKDNTTIDLTAKARGTNYASSNLNVCNFSATDGLIFAGDQGNCTITTTVAGFTIQTPGEVHRFSPTALSNIGLGAGGTGIDVSGNYAFVTTAGAGLKVVDVTDRAHPAVVTTLNLPGTLNDVKLAGTRAYVAAGAAGLHIVDVANPLTPLLVGTFDTADAQDVRVDGNYAYVADNGAGLQIIDISTPTAPRFAGALPGVGTAKGVDVSGNLAVVANGTGLKVVNVTNKTAPSILGTVNLPGDAQDVVMRGNYAFVADYTGSLQVVNIASPAAPVAVATTPTATGGILFDVAIAGNFVFGADIFFVNGVPIVDVSNPSTPIPRAILNFPGDSTGRGVAADGSYVYLVGDDAKLYIGQYRLLEDLEGIPPTVTIASPAPGATFIEGETIPITIVATDDVSVVSVALTVNGAATAIDTSAPYQFTLTAPVGATAITLGASAIDLGPNTGVAAPLQINVTPDPLTTVTGRVLVNGTPVQGAVVHCLAETGVSAANGTFSVPGVRTIQPLIGCTTDYVNPQNITLHGVSTRVAPVRGGATAVGDVQLLAVPIITAIRPSVIDSFRAPTLVRVTGKNLTGAAFVFVADGAAIVTAGTPQIDSAGTSATLPITVILGSQGSVVLVATNVVGASDAFPTGGNTLTVINLPPTADADNDGLTNEYELAIGTSPTNADTDGDGLPDGYEVRYGLNPLVADASVDSDNDGQTNAQEFAAATDPRNAHNVPPVVSETFPVNGATNYPTNGVYIARFAEPLRVALPVNVARAAIDAAVPVPLAVPADLGIAAQVLANYMRSHGEGDSVVPGSVRLFRDAIEVAGAVSLSNDRLSVTFTPSASLPPNTVFTSTVNGVRDAAGTPMSGPFHSTFTTGAVPDTTPPSIIRTNPVSGSGGVPVNAPITLQFNKRINPATLTPENFVVYDNTVGQYLAGVVQADPNGLTASFIPNTPWGIGRSISVYPSQSIRDTGGNAINYYAFSFSVGFGSDVDGPLVTGYSPRSGAANVPVNTQIMVQFNEPLDPIAAAAGVQVYNGAAGVPGSVALSDGNRRITFTPASALAPSTLFTIVPSPDIRDVAGNPAAALPTSSFTTGAQTDTQAPVVTATTPVSGSGGVPTNALIRWVFNEPMNPLTINGGTFYVYPSATGIPIAASYQLSADGRTATVTPISPLAPSTNYGFYTYGATDLSGQLVYWAGSFQTGVGAQVTGPALSVLTPPSGATNVPLNARVVAVMNSAINPGSVNPGALTLSTNGGPVAGTVSLSGDRTVVFTPAAALAASTSYDINLAALTDLAGNAGQPAASTFVTGTATATSSLTLSSVVPPYNSTDIPVNTSFVVTFNGPVDPTSVGVNTMTLYVSGIANLAASYQVNGNAVTITPSNPLPGNTNVYLQIYGVADLAGNCCNYYNNWFRTEAVIDTTAPTVVSVTPASGSTDVGLNAGIVITFSESLNSQTVNNSTVALFANGSRFGGYSGISSDYRSVYLNGGQLPSNSLVTVVATSGITDISGNPLADFSSSFATSAFFDTTRPSVIAVRPGNGAGGVGLTIPLVLFMNDPIDPASAPAALHVAQNGVAVPGNVQVTGDGRVVTFQPLGAWAGNAFVQYFFDSSAHDSSGNAINGYQGSFRTAANPTTATPVPVAITPNYGQSNVPTNVRISVAFNVPLDPASLAGHVRLSGPNGTEAANVSLDPSGTVIRIVPQAAALLPNNYYYVETFPGITSATGVQYPNSGWWYFLTNAATDTVAPTVVSVTPPHGAVKVGDNAGIIVRFSEPINPQTIDATTLSLASALGPIAYSTSFANNNRDVYLTPYQALPDGQVVTVTVFGVTDLSGNAAAPSATQFAVLNGPDISAPAVTATNPANGIGNVPTNVVIELRVNEPLDPVTVHAGTFPIYDNFTGQQLAGTYSLSSDGKTVRFVPSGPLAVYRSFSVYFQYYGSTDVSGNLLGSGGGLGNFTFYTGGTATGAGPQILAVSPLDGLSDVARNAQIVIDFDRPVDTLTANLIVLSAGGQPVPTIIGFGNNDARVYLTPLNPMAGSTLHTLTFGAVGDLTGALGAPSVKHFTTAAGADLIAPVVTMTSPLGGAANVPTNAVVQVAFNERMDPLTVNSGTFYVYPNATGIPIAASYIVAPDGRSATLVPAAPLTPSIGYGLVVYGVTDLVGQTVYYSISFSTGYGPRTSGPTVFALSPPNGSTNVPLNTQVTAYFDEQIVPLSVGPGSLTVRANGVPVPGTVALSGDRQSLTFTPSAQLASSTQYDVAIGGPLDQAGNAAVAAAASFTTGTTTAGTNTFSVSAVTPSFNSVDIPVTGSIHVTFTNPVDPASVSVNTMTLYMPGVANLGATYLVNGNAVTVTPVSPLPGSTTVYFQVYGVRDVAGNAVNYLNSWWRTESVIDTTPPTVIAVTPTTDATGVGLNAPISITFSESLNSNTVNNNTVGLFANGSRFGGYAGISSDYRTVFLSGGTLPANSVVTIAVTSGITDVSGNAAADYTSSFTTGAGFDTSRPSVVGQRPGNGASGVAANVPVVIFMNEPLDAASVAGALQVSQNGQLVNGAVSVSPNGQTLTFQPAAPWAPNALIQVFLFTSARDLNGNAINGYQSSFRTALDPTTTAPTVVAISPTYGAGNVPSNAVVRIAFNVPIDPASLPGALRFSGPNGVVPFTFSLDGSGQVVTMVPGVLQANSYYYTETLPGIRSVYGVPQSNSGWWYFYTGSPADHTAPTVRSVTPPHGAVNVGDNAGIIVRFSEPIDPLSVNSSTLAVNGSLGPVVNSVSFGNGNRDVYLSPIAPLPDGQVVTITLSGVTDVANNVMTPASTQFVVGTGPDLSYPVVVATNPASGLGNVPLNAVIALRVNEPIDASTVHSGTFQIYDNFVGQQIAGTYSVSTDGQTITFMPNARLAANRSHSVYFQYYGITDLAGNTIGPGGGLGNFTFYTGAATSASGPQVVAVTPADQLTNVARNARVVIDFDRSVDTLSAGLLVLAANNQPVPVIIGFGNGDARIYLTPVNPLAANTVYTLTIGPVRDLAGQPMATTLVRHFTTASGVDVIAPVVTMVSPANGAGNVPTNALIQVGFSERVDPLSVNSSTFQVWPQATGVVIPASYIVAADGRSATVVPSAPLSSLTGYYVQVNGITDLVGQTMYVFTSFTTGSGAQTAAPLVLNVSPPANATGVPINAKVSVLVNVPVSPVSLGSNAITVLTGGVPVAGAVSLSGDRQTITFTPAENLTPSTTFTVSAGGYKDVAGNAALPFTSLFTTGVGVTDNGPLVVTSLTPSNGAPEVAVNTTIVASFNKAVNPLSVNSGTFLVNYPGVSSVGGTYSINGATVSFAPASPLPGNTNVFVQVNGVQDLSGIANNYASATFHTAAIADTAAPTVVSVTPVNGASDVGLNAPIVITFSESLNPATVNNNTFALFANGSRFGYVAAISADSRTVTMNGGTLPQSSLVSLEITSGVQDLATNPLEDFTSTFTTALALDTSRPSVVGQRPGNGASNVAVGLPILMFVSERLDGATVPGAVQVTQNGVVVSGTVDLAGGGQAVRFTPSSPWAFGALIQVFMDGSAKDLFGNSLNGYSASFRTIADPASTAPVVTATSPNYGTSNVPLNPVITLGYNLPLDPLTVDGTNVTLSGPNGVVAATVSLDATNQVIRLVPAQPLIANTFYSYQTTTGIRGANGLPQQNGGWWYFVTGTASDAAAPTVRSVTPPHGSTGVGDNATIVVRFNEPVNPMTVNGSTIAVAGPSAAVNTSVSVANGNRDVFLTPNTILPDNAVVSVTIAGVTDLSGNAVAATATQFSVAAGPDITSPVVTSINPASGLGGVPINAVIALRLNEPVDPSTVHSGSFPIYDNTTGQQVSGAYSVSGDSRTVSFVPAAPLSANRSYSVYFAYYGITDLAGNIIGPAGGYGSFGFTTGTTSDTTGPQVVAISPPDAFTNVPRNTQIMIDFDRSIDTLSVDQITVTRAGQPVAVATSFGNGDARVTLTPLVPLQGGSVYSVGVGAVTDLGNIAMANPVTAQFTTGSAVDLAPPSVVDVSPANGATGVGLSSNVVVTFNERMNGLTINGATLQLVEYNTGVHVAGDVVVAGDRKSAAFVPSSPLKPDTTYYIAGNGLSDLTGQQTSLFTTFRTMP